MIRALLGSSIALAAFFTGLFLLKESLVSLRSAAAPLIGRAAGGPIRGVLSGFAATAIVQSSSAVNAAVVGFVAAGILRLEQAFAVVLGANVGTTLTGQIVAFGSFELAAGCLGAGFALAFIGPKKAKRMGAALAGLGGIFFGLYALGRALGPAGLHAFGIDLLARIGGGARAVLVGALATAVIQSSSATTGILIGLADAGALPVDAAIAAALGCNVGTVITTILVSLSAGREARRTAFADLLFNAGGVLAALPILPYLPQAMALISPSPGRQVANAHTLFNLVTVLLAIPFLRPMCRLVKRLVR